MPEHRVPLPQYSDTMNNLKSVHKRMGGQSAIFGNHHTAAVVAVVLTSGIHPGPGFRGLHQATTTKKSRMEETTNERWVWNSNFSAGEPCRISRGCSRIGGGRNGGHDGGPRDRNPEAQDG